MWSPRRPLWRVAVSARALVCVRLGGLGQRRLLGCERYDMVHQEPGPSWRFALATLRRLLEANDKVGAPDLRVVLSGQFTRWELLPWHRSITGAPEFAAYARLRFAQVYGDISKSWTVQCQAPAPGQVAVACAIDTDLLEDLRRACAATGARLQSVAPYFSLAADHWRIHARSDDGWFGAIDDDAVVLAVRHGGAWRGLHARRTVQMPEEVLGPMMAQLALSAGRSSVEGPVQLVGPRRPSGSVLPRPVAWLDPVLPSARGAAGCRMAWGL